MPEKVPCTICGTEHYVVGKEAKQKAFGSMKDDCPFNPVYDTAMASKRLKTKQMAEEKRAAALEKKEALAKKKAAKKKAPKKKAAKKAASKKAPSKKAPAKAKSKEATK